MGKGNKRRWTPEEQRKEIGSAMAIATAANLLLGLKLTDAGKEYTDWMVTQEEMDEELCDTAATHILIHELPFAVELCLKGITSQGGREFRREHNLKLLWTDLEEEERAEIRRRMEDPARRTDERTRREALGITGTMRTVDRIIDDHQDDFKDWRYVVDGERRLAEEKRHLRVDEALMDLYGLVYVCVEFHQSRNAPHRNERQP